MAIEIRYVNIDVTDNGKYLVNWTEFNNEKQQDMAAYAEKSEAFDTPEETLGRINTLFTEILKSKTPSTVVTKTESA